MNFHESILQLQKSKKKALAVLIDPDSLPNKAIFDEMLDQIVANEVDYIFVGGSLTVKTNFDDTIKYIKSKIDTPVIIFPGSIDQLSASADAILFLSLISGRNPELLIGNQVVTAPKIKSMKLEAVSTGYLLISCGKLTTANYISHTLPIPFNKPDIAMATAMAGEMLGMKCIYMDGGSGADQPISKEMISQVKKNIDIPLIIGGGIRCADKANLAWTSGADIVVIGTAFEENPNILNDIAAIKNTITV